MRWLEVRGRALFGISILLIYLKSPPRLKNVSAPTSVLNELVEDILISLLVPGFLYVRDIAPPFGFDDISVPFEGDLRLLLIRHFAIIRHVFSPV